MADRALASRWRHGPRAAPLLSAFAGIVVALFVPALLDDYSVSILIRSLLFGAMAVSVDILWGYTGILSFGQSAFFAIGAYAFGLTSVHLGLTPATAAGALLAAVLLAALIAALVGWLAFGYGVTTLYISVITLVLAVVVVQLLYSGGDYTGSSSGLSGFDTFDISMAAWFRIAAIALVLVTAGGFVLVRSDAGRLLVAIRDNEQRCRYFGIAVGRVKTLLFAGAAIIAALAGYAYAAYTDVIAPDLAGFQFGTELVIWVALGGRGTLLGPAVAAVLIDYVSALLSGNLPFIWQLLLGTVFIAVIVVLPHGLGPALAAPLRRMLPRLATRTAKSSSLLAVPTQDAAGADNAETIAISGLGRSYGSLHVLEDISFTARSGELVSLVGPNGAGKTTLIRCISDGMERSFGRVAIAGHDIGRLPPESIVRLGLGRKFQAPNVFDSLTVADSLRIARARHETLSPWRRAGTIRLPDPALAVIRATGLEHSLATEVRHLSHGGKQALELAMVLAMRPRVLLLDEPTAGLSAPERARIGAILVDLVRQRGLCVLLIEHDLTFVREISSRIIVLHQGRLALDGEVGAVVSSALVRTIYTGEPASADDVVE